MKVIATETGFDNFALREEGDIFDMPAGSKASWFRKATKKELEAAGHDAEDEADDQDDGQGDADEDGAADDKPKRSPRKSTAKAKAVDPDPKVVASEEKVAKDWLPPDQQG